MLSVNQLRKRIKPVTGLKGKKRFETIINNNYYRNRINKLQTHNNNMITKKAKLNIVVSNLKHIEKILKVKSSDDAVVSVEHQTDTINNQNNRIKALKSDLHPNQIEDLKQVVIKLREDKDSLLNQLSHAQIKLDKYEQQPSKVSNSNDDENSINPQGNNDVDKQSTTNNNNDSDNPNNYSY